MKRRGGAMPSTADAAGRRATLIIAVLTLGGVAASLVQTLTIPLLPTLARSFDASPTSMSWVLTANLLTATVCTPVVGRLGDMFGKRPALVCCDGMLVLGSVVCALSPNLTVLVIGRAIQGACVAMVPLAIGIIRDEVPPARVGQGIAMISATAGIGTAIGAPLGGLVVQHTSFRTIFWIAAVVATVAMLGVVAVVPDSPVRSPGRVDVAGAVGLTAALVCLLLPISEGTRWGWTSQRTLGLFAVCGVLFCVWGLMEGRTREPLVDLRVTRLRPVLLTNTTALLLGFVMFTNSLGTSQLVQLSRASGYGFGLSLFGAGLCMVPAAICIMVFAPISARISARHGARFTLVTGCAIISVAYLLRVLLTAALWQVIVGSALVSIGTALAAASLAAPIVASVPSEMTSEAGGVNTLIRMLGGSLSGAVVSAMLAAMVIPGTTFPRESAYLLAFAVSAVAAAIAALTARMTPRHPSASAATALLRSREQARRPSQRPAKVGREPARPGRAA